MNQTSLLFTIIFLCFEFTRNIAFVTLWRKSLLQHQKNIAPRLSSDVNNMEILDLKALYNINVDSIHPNLEKITELHLATFDIYEGKNIIANHTLHAFQLAQTFVNDFYKETLLDDNKKFVILDSGCGVGKSTVILAQENPHIPVIGLDRSINRLSRNRIFNSTLGIHIMTLLFIYVHNKFRSY